MSTPYYIPGFVLDPHAANSADHLDPDPRGLVKIYEPPISTAQYFMGVDPTVGRTLWDRYSRRSDDKGTDNGAIEVVRAGRRGAPDVQVAEFAAPVDAEELAEYANFLGRLYAGASELGQALCIIEIYPGPGLMTLRRMVNGFGYTNHWQHQYLDTLSPRTTSVGSLGWTSQPKSVRDLWIRCSRHLALGKIKLHSTYLVEEMRDCEMDMVKMSGKAIYGKHDDRVRALMLAVWAAHQWSSDIESDDTKAEVGERKPDWQRSACTIDEMMNDLRDMLDDYTNEDPDSS